MKSISAQLRDAINSGKICTLFSLTTSDGLISKHFSDSDKTIQFNGNDFIPSPALQRFSMKLDNTASVSNQNITASVLDLPANELANGRWDNAQIEVAIISWENPSAGKLTVFKGQLGVIQWTDEGFIADIQNQVRAIAKNIGQLVMPTCRHVVYDYGSDGQLNRIGRCGVNKAAFTIVSTVQNIMTSGLRVKIPSSGKPNGWATSGFLKWTTGANASLTSSVKLHEITSDGEFVEFIVPTFQPIQEGDAFELLAGCDRTLGTCKAKFNNVVNFGGFPHLQVDVNANINLG